jgi:SAM-dependent methyltransferase
MAPMKSTSPYLEQINTSLFNGFIGATAIFTLSEIGFFEFIKKQRAITLTDAATELGVDLQRLNALCDTMLAVGILTRHDNLYELTPAGDELMQQLGYFIWAIGGYGNLLLNLPDLALGKVKFGQEVRRNSRYVAQGAAKVGRQSVFPLVCEVLDEIQFEVIADLGCGSAELLIHICQRYPNIHAIGIDISVDACQLARQSVRHAGLDRRITILQANVLDLINPSVSSEAVTQIQRADVVSSFFMLHDLIETDGHSQVILQHFKQTFVRATHFFLGDTMKADSPTELQQQPIFSLAFELVHAFMGHRIWRKQVYDRLFLAADFQIERCIQMPIPLSWLYVLKPGK